MTTHLGGFTLLASTVTLGIASGLVLAEPRSSADSAAAQAHAVLLNRNLARCAALRQCSEALRKNPCLCADEVFPCRVDTRLDKGCEIWLSCQELNIVAPGKLVRAPDLICENPKRPLLRRLSAATDRHLREVHAPQTCKAAADLLVSWLSSDLRRDLQLLPRTEMISFVHNWGSTMAHLFGISDPERKNDALLRDCTVPMKQPIDLLMASMNLLDMVWLMVQGPEARDATVLPNKALNAAGAGAPAR
jgi:hypothetical protein